MLSWTRCGDQLGRAAADVDDHRPGVELAAGGHPPPGHARLVVAGEELRREAVAPLDLAEERLAVLGVPDGARPDRERALGAEALELAPVVGEHVAHPGDRQRQEAPARVHALAESGDRERPPDFVDPALVDVRDEQPRRVRAQVDSAHTHGSVVAARALKAGAGRADLGLMRHLLRARTLALALAVPVAAAAFAWWVAQASTGDGRVVSITEGDFHISAPAAIHGGTVRLRIHNLGPDTHELLIARAPAGRLPLRADGLTVDEEEIHLSALEGQERGKTDDLRVRLTPGRYVLFCNMAGHYLAGMRRTILVR